jgi:hypothetical protein
MYSTSTFAEPEIPRDQRSPRGGRGGRAVVAGVNVISGTFVLSGIRAFSGRTCPLRSSTSGGWCGAFGRHFVMSFEVENVKLLGLSKTVTSNLGFCMYNNIKIPTRSVYEDAEIVKRGNDV